MANKIYYSPTLLTGGTAAALDYIDGNLLVDGDIAHVFVSGVMYHYKLNASSGAAESSPSVISPDTNAGDKRWELQTAYQAAGYAPWIIDIDVFNTAGANTNWSTLTPGGGDAVHGYRLATDAINNLVSWPVYLPSGTWTFSLIHLKNSNHGIISVQFDGVEQGTIDCYAGGGSFNNVSTLAGLVVAASAKITLMLKVTGKNGSSSGYIAGIQHVRLLRTA